MMGHHDHDRDESHPRNLWGKRVRIAPSAMLGRGTRERVVNIRYDIGEDPRTFALQLSTRLDPALAIPLYEVRIGIGEENYEWLALPPPAAGSVYVVQAHRITVDVYESNVGAGTEVMAYAGPTLAVPTLTP